MDFLSIKEVTFGSLLSIKEVILVLILSMNLNFFLLFCVTFVYESGLFYLFCVTFVYQSKLFSLFCVTFVYESGLFPPYFLTFSLSNPPFLLSFLFSILFSSPTFFSSTRQRAPNLSSSQTTEVWNNVIKPTLVEMMEAAPTAESKSAVSAIQTHFEEIATTQPMLLGEFLTDMMDNLRKQPTLRRMFGALGSRLSTIALPPETASVTQTSRSAAYLQHRWRRRVGDEIHQL